MFFVLTLFMPILAYLIMLLFVLYYIIKTNKITPWGLVAFVLIIVFLLVKAFQMGDLYKLRNSFNFFFGWSIAVSYLYYTRTRININTLVLIYSIEIILEGILINSIVPANILPNYSALNIENSSHVTAFWGFYQRVYSICANATMSATVLVLCLTYREMMRKQGADIGGPIIDILSLIAVFMLMSGTGFFLYLIFLVYKYNLLNPRNVLLFLFFLLIIVYLSREGGIMEQLGVSKFSLSYLLDLIEFKINQNANYQDEFNLVATYKYIGASFRGGEGLLIYGDFAIGEFFIMFGLCGYIILSLFIIKYINNYNKYIILIALVGFCHYSGIGTVAGQLILAYAFLYNKNNRYFYFEVVRSPSILKDRL